MNNNDYYFAYENLFGCKFSAVAANALGPLDRSLKRRRMYVGFLLYTFYLLINIGRGFFSLVHIVNCEVNLVWGFVVEAIYSKFIARHSGQIVTSFNFSVKEKHLEMLSTLIHPNDLDHCTALMPV